MNQTNADLQKMRSSLEKCKAQIFDMQPLEHLTDSELKDQYKDLCDTIGVFAELQFGDSDNPLQELLAAVPPPQLQHPVQTCFTRDGYIELVKKFPEAGVSFVRCLLARYSYYAALDERKYYPGLGAEKEAFLAFLEQALSTGPAKRGDQSFVDAWRTDVQRAFPTSSPLATTSRQYLSEQATSISDMLACLISEDAPRQPIYENCSKIISEAENLAHSIRKSPASYGFEPAFSPVINRREKVLWVDDLDTYRLVNAETGSEIHKPGMIDVDEDGRAGEKLCVVHPALIHRGRHGKADKTLVEAMLLVKLDRPLLR